MLARFFIDDPRRIVWCLLGTPFVFGFAMGWLIG